MNLVPGNIYKRTEVQASYGGSPQGGITPTKDSKKVFIWSNESGPHHGYQDGWSDDGSIYYYTGAGQTGDQDLEAPRHNGRLKAQREWRRSPPLSGKGPGGQWKYEANFH